MKKQLELDAKIGARLVWSRPDSNIVPSCSLCGEYIPADAIPLMMWNDHGACVHICDRCTPKAIKFVPASSSRP